jgi:thiosulfate dehydrogenase
MENDMTPRQIGKVIRILVSFVMLLLIFLIGVTASLLVDPEKFQSFFSSSPGEEAIPVTYAAKTVFWSAPKDSMLPAGNEGEEIKYGRELIVHTSEYLGPRGKVLIMSNGMNCQNCHLDAGTKPFGNNYSAVASTYPKLRARSGTEETIEKRVNDCFERSLNGKPLLENSREMKAIVAYIKWLGTGVPKGESPKGSGLIEVPFLDRAADSETGKILYEEKCTVCHGLEGEGIANAGGTSWTYPPLWGKDSYNIGAGLFRLSRFAGYIKANMPLGATHEAPLLTDEQAWDLAAYVNWPDISKKAIDHPFGPFADGFSEMQHKLGPFKPIEARRKELNEQIKSR